MSESASVAIESPPKLSEKPAVDWLLTAFLAYFLIIAAVITGFVLVAWNNG